MEKERDYFVNATIQSVKFDKEKVYIKIKSKLTKDKMNILDSNSGILIAVDENQLYEINHLNINLIQFIMSNLNQNYRLEFKVKTEDKNELNYKYTITSIELIR